MDTHQLQRFRANKDEYFGTSQHSPLPHHLRHDFTGLEYYPPNAHLAFTLPVEEADHASIAVQTSDGAARTYERVGTVSFEVDGQGATLTLYSTGDEGFFVPFRDATSGQGSYGAGRYLDLRANADGTVTVDFNYAYNPFCAYDDAYSCPLPPVENWLSVPIEAGERDFVVSSANH